MGEVEEGKEMSMAWRMVRKGLVGVPAEEEGESEPVFSST
jgi:hypothetical protein